MDCRVYVGPGGGYMDRSSPRCREECKILSISGVLTLDEEERLGFFCDQCRLHP